MTMLRVHNPVQKNISSFIDEVFNELPSFGKTINNLFTPAVNITETQDSYRLDLMVPGRNKEEFNIIVENGLLTISYEKKEEVKKEGETLVRNEFAFQSFKRSFNLDEKINAEGIEATYENGILKLLLPKIQELKQPVKNITIQ